MTQAIRRGARLSRCRQYRYRLSRVWDETRPIVLWVMLNPSTADAYQDDPTIRRCISFSKREGYGGLIVVNLFALRSAYPDRLGEHADPIGPANDRHIRHLATKHRNVIVAWGAGKLAESRTRPVFDTLASASSVMCLGRTTSGQPRHPVRLANDTPLESAR